MLRPRELLQRFRFVGAPGAAAGGVPADRAAQVAAELEPVLASLDDAQDQAHRIRAGGSARAERIRRRGEARAEAQLSAARSDAPALREQAAGAVVDRTIAELTGLRGAADQRAGWVRQRAASRIPEYVDRVVEMVVDSIMEGAG